MNSKQTDESKFNPSWLVYLIGIFSFGVFYEQLKTELGGGVLFVAAAIGYSLVLRFLGDYLARKWHERKST